MTKTKIRQLDGEESVQELGRILGGAKITDAVLENAREMKILASGLKNKIEHITRGRRKNPALFFAEF